MYYRKLLAGLFAASTVFASPAIASVTCNMSGYRSQSGLAAQQNSSGVTITWDGDAGQSVRLKIAIIADEPVIAELALRQERGAWTILARNAAPEFTVTTGVRRISGQQLAPLRDLGIPITQEVLDRYRWDPFWDAPLDMAAPKRNARGNFPMDPPPPEGIPGTDQTGLPRNPAEVQRAKAVFSVRGCEVVSNGGRLEISYPGVKLGPFEGRLQYTVYKGTNLIRQEVVAKTSAPWVAYKYDAGVRNLSIRPGARVAWRDAANDWQTYQFGAVRNDRPVPLQSRNRLVFAEQEKVGSLAAFPPPHKFFWAREVATNLGYNWYRKDSETTFAIGIRQSEEEDDSRNPANFALYSARPDTWQLMPVYLYPSLKNARDASTQTLAFTHGDHYKLLPGFQVMNHHYHMDLGKRLLEAGDTDRKLPDLVALKALGINIVSQVDTIIFRSLARSQSTATPPASTSSAEPDQVAVTAASVAGARRHSDKDFLIMPSQEVYGSPIGGHTDLLFSRPVFWNRREPGQPLSEPDPNHGTIYHIGSADDFMTMARQEHVLISMPHPRTKGSTGYPEAIKDQEYFKDPHYGGIGVRWGMGLDGSERRSCEYRCLPLLDEMTNWMVDQAGPLKTALSISEVRLQAPQDELYSSSPVSYVRLATLPSPDDASSVIEALSRGDFFWTTGEVLIPHFAVEGEGSTRRIVADVEWTFPLDFVEVVWGDGKNVGRQVIATTDLAPFGRKRFEIPLDVTGKKWVRFAAWDSASEGAFVQPVRLR